MSLYFWKNRKKLFFNILQFDKFRVYWMFKSHEFDMLSKNVEEQSDSSLNNLKISRSFISKKIACCQCFSQPCMYILFSNSGSKWKTNKLKSDCQPFLKWINVEYLQQMFFVLLLMEQLIKLGLFFLTAVTFNVTGRIYQIDMSKKCLIFEGNFVVNKINLFIYWIIFILTHVSYKVFAIPLPCIYSS